MPSFVGGENGLNTRIHSKTAKVKDVKHKKIAEYFAKIC